MAQLRLVQDVTQESFAAGTVAMQRKVLESGHSHDVMRHLVNWRVRRYYQAWCEVRPQQPCLIEMCENACGVSRAKKSVAIPGVAPRPGVRSQRHGAWRRAAACRAATCPGNTTLRSSLRHRCCGQATPFKKDLRKMGVVTARRKALIERLGQPAEPHGNAVHGHIPCVAALSRNVSACRRTRQAVLFALPTPIHATVCRRPTS